MTFFDFLNSDLTGLFFAVLGFALATALACWGSAKAVGMVGQAAGGLLTENPGLFGKALLLQALPGTQGIYGMIVSFIGLFKLGLFSGGAVSVSPDQGLYLLFACLPIAIVGFLSAIHQGKVAVTGINLLSKRPDEVGKAITSAALVETYAIFSLLISLLMVVFAPIG